MKAIILAGGEGTRLRPLTERMPKPMIEIAGRPVLEHTITHLSRCGFKEIMLTLRYMPEAVINHFRIASGGSVWATDYGDVTLQYRVENTPRGTAGAVADCMEFIGGDDILVMSGDCLCDFDVGMLLQYHKNRGGALTLALYECAEPIEYGLVITDENDCVRGFTEKPAWERVLTDCVNTGIYALSPTVLEHVPQSGMVDFAKDLFPLLLKSSIEMYAVPLGGYWRDIGTQDSLTAAMNDAESGIITLCAPEKRRSVNTGRGYTVGVKPFQISFAMRGTIAGTPGEHLPYEALLRLGQACAQYKRVGYGYCGGDLARSVTELLASGSNVYGAETLMLDAPLLSAASYAARMYNLPLTVFVTQRGESVRISFYDENGLLIKHGDERKIASSAVSPKMVSTAGTKTVVLGIREAYVAWIREKAEVSNRRINAVCSGGGEAAYILREALRLKKEISGTCADSPEINAGIVVFTPGADGTTLLATTENGKVLDFEHLLLLGTYIALRRGAKALSLPSNAPEMSVRLAESYGRTATRSDEKDTEYWTKDGILLASIIASYIAEHNISLITLSRAVPDFTLVERTIHVRGGRAAVMRELTRTVGFEAATEFGIELRPGGGVAYICPDRGEQVLRVRIEAQDARAAETISTQIERQIHDADV